MSPEIFQNAEFFLLLPFVLLVLQISKYAGRKVFVISMLICSFIFIFALPGITYAYLITSITALILIFSIIKLFILSTERNSRFLFFGTIFVWLFFVMILKYRYWVAFSDEFTPIAGVLNESLLPLFGFAFMAVRVYSVIVDARAGKILKFTLLDFLTYIFWFPAFLSGPIERFDKFVGALEGTLKSKEPILALWLQNLPRFLIGCFKVFVIAGLLNRLALPFMVEGGVPSSLMLIYIGAFFYYWYEYVNFSGYSDLAISTSKTVGISLPENFNHPYLATSLTDLWRRWHMTLAGFLRDYIYYPLFFFLVQKLSRITGLSQIKFSAISIFITFGICGIWHGETYGMLYFGFASGLVLAIETLISRPLSKAIEQRISRFDRFPILGYIYPWFKRFLTLHLAMLTFAPVLLSNSQFVVLFGGAP